jgi:hypothetical protein
MSPKQDDPPKKQNDRLLHVAMLGTRGLQVNDPAEQYSLNSIPGKFSGLHLLCSTLDAAKRRRKTGG